MPLSDNEQRLLEQMERALYAEDPKFASAMRGASRRRGVAAALARRRRWVVVGLVVLVLGVAGGAEIILLGVLGFVLMLAGTAYAVSAQRRTGPTGVVTSAGSVRAHRQDPPAQGTFMQRLEERWDRRRDER